MTRQFPMILVERPHQLPAKAWIAYQEADLIACLATSSYADNWSWERFADETELLAVYARDEWPEDFAAAPQYPAIAALSPAGFTITPESEKCGGSLDTIDDDEVQFALDCIGHDLHCLTLLESAEEARAYLARGHRNGHNAGLIAVEDEARCLDWID